MMLEFMYIAMYINIVYVNVYSYDNSCVFIDSVFLFSPIYTGGGVC